MAEPTLRQVSIGTAVTVGHLAVFGWLCVTAPGMIPLLPALYGAVATLRRLRLESQLRRSVDEVTKWASGFGPTTDGR